MARRAFGLEVRYFLASEQRALLRRVVARDERRAEGSHKLGYVGAHDVALRDELEGAQQRVVLERPALNDYFLAELGRVFYLQNFVERVADYGVDEARGDVLDGRALLLRLADA